MDLLGLLMLVVGVAVGGVAGYFVASARLVAGRASASEELASLRTRLAAAEDAVTTAERASAQRLADQRAAADAELTRTREDAAARLGDAERRHARTLAEAEERAAEELRRAEQRAAETVRTLEERGRQEVLTLREDAERRLEEVKADQKRLADEFAALSKQALDANAKTFLEQAEERLKRTGVEQAAELAKREAAVKNLVEPLEKTLAQVKEEMTSAERSRLAAHASLAEQVKGMRETSDQLRTETSALVTALRAPQVRGQWGEMQLRRTVEAAGMVEHVSFEEQVRLEDGKLRPDLVVTLPDGKQVVVDSKVAFNGYLEAMEARDDRTRSDRLAAHARHMRTHVDQLSGKEYWSHLDATPEFTVMFVPSEVFLDAALQQDPTLLEYAFGKNVVPATPATLVALLRTVAYTWRQERLAKDAAEVFKVGRELHKRLATFGKHLDTLAKRLNSTVEAFNAMSSSLDRNVVTQVRRLSATQGLEAAFEVPAPLEVLAVPAQKADLREIPADLLPAAPAQPAGGELVAQPAEPVHTTQRPGPTESEPTQSTEPSQHAEPSEDELAAQRAERERVLAATDPFEGDDLLAELTELASAEALEPGSREDRDRRHA